MSNGQGEDDPPATGTATGTASGSSDERELERGAAIAPAHPSSAILIAAIVVALGISYIGLSGVTDSRPAVGRTAATAAPAASGSRTAAAPIPGRDPARTVGAATSSRSPVPAAAPAP